MTDPKKRSYDRITMRSAFQSLFWNVLLARKRENGFTFKTLADTLGINKSYVSRSFSTPPNWQIDKLCDMAEALNVDLIIEARDRATGVIYTPTETRTPEMAQPAQNNQKIETGSISRQVDDAGPGERRVVSIIAAGAA